MNKKLIRNYKMKKIILFIVFVWMCVFCGNLEEMNIDLDNVI